MNDRDYIETLIVVIVCMLFLLIICVIVWNLLQPAVETSIKVGIYIGERL